MFRVAEILCRSRVGRPAYSDHDREGKPSMFSKNIPFDEILPRNSAISSKSGSADDVSR